MKKVAIIGAGPAGVEAASIISNNGFDVELFEKSSNSMKNLHDKAFLFPNFVAADDIINILDKKLLNKSVVPHYDTEIINIQQETEHSWKLIDQKNQSYYAASANYELYMRDEVKEAYGVIPEQIIVYLALVCDTADNVPGVAGIGAKTAEKLLGEYLTLDGIYRKLDILLFKQQIQNISNLIHRPPAAL